MIDAQPGEGWLVPLALVSALMDDPQATDAALAALEPLAEPGSAPPPRNMLWRRAAGLGMTDPELRRATVACFAAADRALARRGGSGRLRRALGEFAERYPVRGRCPADDQLDAVRTGAHPISEETAAC